MARCAAFGAKRPGDANDRKMSEHIAQRFRAAGLDTSFEDFNMPRYDVRSTSLQVVGGKAVHAETFACSAPSRRR